MRLREAGVGGKAEVFRVVSGHSFRHPRVQTDIYTADAESSPITYVRVEGIHVGNDTQTEITGEEITK